MTEKKGRGRAKGQVSKKVIIADPLLGKYNISVDEGSNCFIIVNTDTDMNEGYYTTVSHALKAIAKKQTVPVGFNNTTMTLSEYLTAIKSVEKRLMDFTHNNEALK